MSDLQSNEPAMDGNAHRRYSRLGPIIIGVLVAIIFVVQGTAPYTDHQISNMVTAGLLLGCLAVAGIWWFRNIPSGRIRWLFPLACVMLPAVGLLLYQPVGFTGELVPIFRYRFSPPKDLQTTDDVLATPSESLKASKVLIDQNCSPVFLGPNRDGRFPTRTFSKDWTSQPPRQIWKQPIGGGLAGIATAKLAEQNDQVTSIGITIEQRGQNEAVTCYDLDSGKLRWVVERQAYHSHPLGDVGPRSTPSISADGLVFVQGATGHVWCINVIDGAVVWEQDLLEIAGIDQETSEQAVTWGRAASPLLAEDLVILPLGGSEKAPAGINTLIAFDAATGAERWRAGKYQISYASPIAATLNGVQQIVSVNQDFVSGHSLETGKELWSHSWPGVSNGGASCSNPSIVNDNQILLSKGYGGGSMLLNISRVEDRFEAEEIWSDMRLLKTKFTNPVIVDNFAYGLSDGTLECVAVDTGERRWRQSRSTRFGHGHILVVEDVIVASTEDGQIVLVDLNSDQYEELGRIDVVEGKTWNPPAIIDNKILLRNGNEMSIWDLNRS